MSNIEFQMNAATFLAAQRNALRYLGLCPPSLPAVGGVQIVVDRIEIGNNSLRHNEEEEFPIFYEEFGQKVSTKNRCKGYKTQIAQDVTFYLTTLGDILANPNQSPSVLVPITATLVFDLDFYVAGEKDDECFLKATLADKGVELDPISFLPPIFNPLTSLPKEIQEEIKQYLSQQVRPFIPSPAIPVGMGKFANGTRFLNAGVSIDDQMHRIAFRAQVGGSHTNLDIPWSNFFKGFFPDRLQGSDWGLFVEAGLLTETIKTLIYQRLPKDDNLQAFPGCTYSNAGGQAVLNIDVLLIYHLYRNYDIGIDLSAQADPKVGIQLSVDTPNWLTVNFDFSHLLDSDDPMVNLALDLASLVSIPVETILFQLVGSAAMAELTKTPFEICHQPSLGHIKCDKYVPIPQVPGTLQTAINSLLALDDGISLVGSMNISELTPAIVKTSFREFKEQAPSISCGPASMALVAAFQQDPSGFAVLHARASIENQGTAPLNLCSPPIVLRGANGPFPQSAIRTDVQQAPIQISVDIAAPSQDYYDAPYPFDMLVRTSGGTRLIRIDPPPRVTLQDYKMLVAELLVKIGDCEKLVDPWFRLHQGYNPQWSPRPPEDSTVQHLWQVVISDLPAGDRVALVGSDNQELVTAVGTGNPMRLSAVVLPGGEKELSIMHVGGQLGGSRFGEAGSPDDSTKTPPCGCDTAQHGLEVRQTVLVQLGSIPLSKRCQNLVATNMFSGQCLAAILDEGISAFDFSTPHRPVLVRSWQIEGVRGALNWQGKLLIFGQEGVEWIDRTGQRNAASANCDLRLILDATGDRQALYALTKEGLNIYSKRLCRIGAVPIEGSCSIARVGKKIVIGGQRGLAVFDTENLHSPQGERFVEDMRVSAVRSTLMGDADSFVAVLEDGNARLFRFNQGYPEEIGRYSGTPWFMETVRLGGRIVKIGVDRRCLDIYRFGDSSII